MEKPQWRRLASTYLVNSVHLRLRTDRVELPNGTVLDAYYVRESNGFVIAVALTPEREVVLVRQYRYGVDAVVIELPAGTIDEGEDPLDCAKRELAEETGYTAERWEPLMTVAAEPVRSNSVVHCYLAYEARRTVSQKLDPTESIEPFTVSLEELRGMLRRGEFGAMSAVAAAYAALDTLH
jgi:ADP-ribose pyrophosphatase